MPLRSLVCTILRPPRGLCEAHLHQAYKSCAIGRHGYEAASASASASALRSRIIHSIGLVMALLQLHMVYKFSEDKLHRPPMVALNELRIAKLLISSLIKYVISILEF